ncbi:hypothetical protein IJJ05_01390 [Candidatus Saccharibacteria bacterium]|nr:hypothetical protein [Candidatus Saccharibacteria bacterium]
MVINKNKGYFSLLMLTNVFLAAFSAQVWADTEVIDDINVAVPVSCTLSGTGMNSHNAIIPNGTSNSHIGDTTIKVYCNDKNGFSIYAIGYTDNKDGKNVLTDSSLGSSFDIATGTGTSGNSQWAMKLSTNSGAAYPVTIMQDTEGSFGNFHTVPNDYALVARRTADTDMGAAATGSTLTTTYQAYISATQSMGNYAGQVKYVMVHPYDGPAPVPCNSNATTIAQVKCLQDFAHVTSTNLNSIISSMTPETQYTLKDSRDGKSYTIAKYQVGATNNYDIWMTQNLDLDLDASKTYTNEDTDIGYNTSTGQYTTAAWSPARSTYPTSTTGTGSWCNGGTWNSEYGDCEINNTPESYDPGNLYWNGTESGFNDWNAYYDSCDWSTSTPVCNESLNPISTYTSSTGTAEYHLGNYYNWTAAVAMNDSSSHTTNNELIEQSICPAGWTLPRVRGYGEDTFYALWNQYGFANSSINGANKLWTSPLYFAASGYWYGALHYVGGLGYFWSPVVYNSDNAGSAYFDMHGYSYPSFGDGRSYGRSVRCVARPVVSSIIGG